MNKNLKTYRLIIKGKVQEVGFRYWFNNLANSALGTTVSSSL